MKLNSFLTRKKNIGNSTFQIVIIVNELKQTGGESN